MKELRLEFQPLGRRVGAREGETVLQVAHRAGIDIVSICGGQGTCGQCRVRILQGGVSPPTPLESAYLGQKELAAGFRLACQAQIQGDLSVSIPPESLEGEQRLQVAGRERVVAPEPLVRGYTLRLEVPQFGNLTADRERVLGALEAQYGLREATMDFAALQALPRFLRKANWQGEVFVRHGEVISFGRAGDPPLGMAVDLGTTKLAFYLVDLASGGTLANEGAMNPQLLHGEDVMTRIAYASQEAEGGRVLQGLVTDLINQVVDRMCRAQGFTSTQVVDMVVVGNTAMHHLFLGLPVEQLGVAPYLAAASSAVDVKARELGVVLAPGAWVHALPNVAGFVGADHVAMILASELDAAKGVVLGLDIGTNTEVVLARDGEMVSCSCASGPAFEGGHILHGMRAASGAIERVEMAGGQLKVATIDSHPAVGICGSGILDAVAVLYSAGALNYRGRMQADHPLVREGERGLEVVLVEGAGSGTGQDIVITQEDINQIQLAKGAIRTGIEMLLRAMEVDLAEVERVVIAGAFGMYIHPESAVQIGLFPRFPRAEFEQIGNAAGMGAKLALLSRRERARAQGIAACIEYIELMSQPNFMENFALSMYLPR